MYLVSLLKKLLGYISCTGGFIVTLPNNLTLCVGYIISTIFSSLTLSLLYLNQFQEVSLRHIRAIRAETLLLGQYGEHKRYTMNELILCHH
jgi:hypothetical protein